jgi:signal peptidase I
MRRLLRLLLWTAILLGALIGVARGFALRWWTVPVHDPYLQASVAPTLAGGDLVILWRLTKPRFGDLVVCPEPDAPERVVLARLAGEAGDEVTIDESNVMINGRAPRSERACNSPKFVVKDPNVGTEVEQDCQIENLNGHVHMRGSTGAHKLQPLSFKHEVGPGKAFLLSDNRLYPYDSRDYGTVDRASCKESVLFRIVSAKGFFDEATRFTLIR